jgi:uncharacterized protein (DUF2141 family)
VSSQKQLLQTDASQVMLRSIQSRAFDTTDREKTLRTIIATLQDLGFIVNKADALLGTVSATKLDKYALQLTVSIRPRGKTQTLVRVNAQYFNPYSHAVAVEDPEPYQNFFTSLSKAMFLEAHETDGSAEEAPEAKAKTATKVPKAAKAPKAKAVNEKTTTVDEVSGEKAEPEKKEAEEAVEDTEMVTEAKAKMATKAAKAPKAKAVNEVTEEAVKDTEKTHEQIILNIHIKGIENYLGELGVAVFEKKKGYPIHIEHCYEAQWVALTEGTKELDFVFDTLSPGVYAVSVIHDENGNRTLERSGMGAPREGVGFSNDQKFSFLMPRFDKSKLPLVLGDTKNIVITMDYKHRK